jgi:hypothetical protein
LFCKKTRVSCIGMEKTTCDLVQAQRTGCSAEAKKSPEAINRLE